MYSLMTYYFTRFLKCKFWCPLICNSPKYSMSYIQCQCSLWAKEMWLTEMDQRLNSTEAKQQSTAWYLRECLLNLPGFSRTPYTSAAWYAGNFKRSPLPFCRKYTHRQVGTSYNQLYQMWHQPAGCSEGHWWRVIFLSFSSPKQGPPQSACPLALELGLLLVCPCSLHSSHCDINCYHPCWAISSCPRLFALAVPSAGILLPHIHVWLPPSFLLFKALTFSEILTSCLKLPLPPRLPASLLSIEFIIFWYSLIYFICLLPVFLL